MESLSLVVRKFVVSVEETLSVHGRPVAIPTRKAVAAAIIENPFAGTYIHDLTPLVDASPLLSAELAKRCLDALGVEVGEVTAYGKGAIVGLNGEVEHAAAIIHPKFGAPIRAAIGGGAAIIPSTKIVAGPGFRLTMPLTNRDDIWVFDDMDAVAVSVDDAPGPNEIVIAVALATGGRPLHRITKAV
jgi:hypothetical protein